MNEENEPIATVPVVIAESQAQRCLKLIRWIFVGWATSTAALSAVIAWAL